MALIRALRCRLLSALDAIDVVSLLLAGAISILLVGRIDPQGLRLTALTRALLLAGATLILGYFFSEIVHALKRLR